MNKKVSKILALAMAFVLVLSMAGVALANTFTPASGYAYVTDTVNVRTGPGTSYSILGSYDRGDKVTIMGTVSNGWTQIRIPNGMLGYVSSSYLSSSASSGGYPVVVPSGSVFKVTTAALNIRSGPGTNYRVLGVLKKGDQVTRIVQDGKWFKIATSNNSDAWVSSKYLAGVDGYPVYGDTASATLYATTGLNVRSGPGTNYSIVGGLNRGDHVTRIGKSGNWTKISWGSGSAYVFSKYLQTSSTSGGSQTPSGSYYTRYATGLLNVRTGPGTNYSLLGSVGAGQALTCVGTDGNWTRILWGSGYAYVYTAYLSGAYYGGVYPGGDWEDTYWNTPARSAVVALEDAELYSRANSNSAYYVDIMPAGAKATLVSYSGSWAKIRYAGSIYYTATNLLAYRD